MYEVLRTQGALEGYGVNSYIPEFYVKKGTTDTSANTAAIDKRPRVIYFKAIAGIYAAKQIPIIIQQSPSDNNNISSFI